MIVNEIHRLQMLIGLLLLVALFSYTLARTFGRTAAVLLGYVLISAVVVFMAGTESGSNHESILLRMFAAKSFAQVSMLAFFAYVITRPQAIWLVTVFQWVAVVDCALIFAQGYGLLNSGSMDATFLAMVLPTIALRTPPPIKAGDGSHLLAWIGSIIVVLIAIMDRKGSTAFGVLIASFGGYFLLRRSWRWAFGAVAAAIAAGYLATGKEMLNDSYRFVPWRNIMSYWHENANPLIGTGTGTFQRLGPIAQDFKGPLLVWMHNEPLQVLFEQGIIGLVLMLAVCGICLWRARRTPWLFAANLGTLAACLTYFPLRFMITQMFVVLLLKLSLEEAKS